MPPRMLLLITAIHSDHAGAAQTQIMLQGYPGILDLTFFRLTAQLPDQLGALGQTGGSQRMAFR